MLNAILHKVTVAILNG